MNTFCLSQQFRQIATHSAHRTRYRQRFRKGSPVQIHHQQRRLHHQVQRPQVWPHQVQSLPHIFIINSSYFQVSFEAMLVGFWFSNKAAVFVHVWTKIEYIVQLNVETWSKSKLNKCTGKGNVHPSFNTHSMVGQYCQGCNLVNSQGNINAELEPLKLALSLETIIDRSCNLKVK